MHLLILFCLDLLGATRGSILCLLSNLQGKEQTNSKVLSNILPLYKASS